MLQLLMAWAWLGWVTLTFLLVPTVWLVSSQQNWKGQYFDTWGHRTFHGDYMFSSNKEASLGYHGHNSYGWSRQASGTANLPKIQVSVRKEVESLPPPMSVAPLNIPSAPTAPRAPSEPTRPTSPSSAAPIAPPKNSVLRGKGRVPSSVEITEPKQAARKGGYF